MPTERLDVRLDKEHRRKIEVLASEQNAPVSAVVRHLIDKAYEETLKKRRIQAARELGEMQIEDAPDPEILNRQLDETHDPGLP